MEVSAGRPPLSATPVNGVRRRLVGGAAAALLAASAGLARISLAAPPGKKWLIGGLLFEEPDRGRETRLRESLAALGYVEGRNTRYEFRYWARDDARLAALAAELVALKPDVLVTVGTVTTRALAKATSTIPIVTSLTDPAEVGIARIGQPGGNITGLSVAYRETATKAIEYLKAMAPDVKRLAFPVPGGDSHTRSLAETWEACARSLGVELHRIDPGPQGELKPILASLRQKGVRAMVSTLWRPEPRGQAERKQEAAVYVAHQIATLTTQVEDVRDGLLLCFRGDPPDSRRGMATILDRILRGTPVGEIPFELPSKYTLAVNRGTASALGLAIPPELLVRASVVYE